MNPLYDLLKNDTEAAALLGGDPLRVYQYGEAEKGVAHPYIVTQVYTGETENYLQGDADMDRMTFQTNVYADTAAEVAALVNIIRRVIIDQAYIIGWRGESKDPATALYLASFDIDWFIPYTTEVTS